MCEFGARLLWDSAGVSAPAVAAPSGVVTFLFTDVEGSTRRWEADADAMRVALAAHDLVLRGAIEAHRGWLFKHTGDGMCAAFASPGSAVDAAVAAQKALELPVRMGLATGEAELRDGDYFGAVLNRAARVMAAGNGGQILLTESTAVLLGGVDLVGWPGGIAPPGSHRSRRDSLPSPGSCPPGHQTHETEEVHAQCANMRGYRATIPRQHSMAFLSARNRLYFLRIQRTR